MNGFLKNFSRNRDQSIPVDRFMQVSERVFAAGDIVDFPLSGGRRARIEHWRVAQEQAFVAASNMMDLKEAYRRASYFWTYHYGTRFEFFGQVPDQYELLIDGDLNQSKFIAGYISEDRCEAIFAANREAATARLLDHMEREGALSLQAFDRLVHAE